MSPNLQEKSAVSSDKHPADQVNGDSMVTAARSHELAQLQSHGSHSNETPIQPYISYIEVPDEVYDRLSPSKKVVIVCLLSFSSFLSPLSSTTILSAVPEVAATYNTTGSIINLSNALYLVFMAISPCIWGPLSQVYGRRWV